MYECCTSSISVSSFYSSRSRATSVCVCVSINFFHNCTLCGSWNQNFPNLLALPPTPCRCCRLPLSLSLSLSYSVKPGLYSFFCPFLSLSPSCLQPDFASLHFFFYIVLSLNFIFPVPALSSSSILSVCSAFSRPGAYLRLFLRSAWFICPRSYPQTRLFSFFFTYSIKQFLLPLHC